MFLTNVVCSANLSCRIELRELCYQISNAIYDPSRFPGLVWRHKRIGGSCLVFSTGVIHCSGHAESFRDGKRRLRKYSRCLQKLGFPVILKDVKCMTASAFHILSSDLDIDKLIKDRNAVHEPELFPATVFKQGGVTFSCFANGKVVIAGIKGTKDVDGVVYPTLVELELYTRNT